LVSSQVGQVAPSHRPRWTRRRRLAAALSLLADPALDALLAPPTPFAELPARLADLLAPESAACPVIDYATEGT
ncbi:MAG TPA: dehydrogenase, partial [Xanthobacteraceae bacterium]|nr:dehydrogenase [Xanthobacteraceae bacterium]